MTSQKVIRVYHEHYCRIAGMFDLQTHLQMLSDKTRVDSFRRAIMETVSPGDVVADIGTGTGILAFFAIQAGARKVYAVEAGPILEVARRTARENGYSDRICFVGGNSTEVELPEPVDVIVTETVGCLAFDEGITAVVNDARRRFLKPGGRMIPQGLLLKALPVSFARRHPFGFLDRDFYGLETGHLRHLAANTVFSLRSADLDPVRPLAAAGDLWAINLQTCAPVSYPVQMKTRCRISSEGRFDGMLVFPEVVLTSGRRIRLLDGERFAATHWEFTFFPNSMPLPVSAGGRLGFDVTITAENGFVWRIAHHQNGQARVFSHLSLFGRLSLSHLIRPPAG